jgi:agmatine/peptidylarginine deiminase
MENVFLLHMALIRLPAEWEAQDAIQITFPHPESDWSAYWDAIIPCYREIVQAIARHQPLIIVCRDEQETKHFLKDIDWTNILFVEIPCNDTWARDHGAITVFQNGKPVIYDFVFNGWGLKFPADKDNLITRQLFDLKIFKAEKRIDPGLVLEGGGIESDGKGTLLTTAHCMLSPNRNPHLSKEAIEEALIGLFGLKRVLWLEHGHLEGDDTDSHIDTVARFCDEHTIAYVQCTDMNDTHYIDLKKMEDELQAFRQLNGKPYELIALPMADAIYAPDDERRLPATYANFLILNDVVLMPTYNVAQDKLAISQLQQAFPRKKVTGVPCRALLLQHGSLHCITMQYPKGSVDLSKWKN